MSGPMEGIKVLDFSMGVAGPHAGMLCAQYGAEVTKIESLVGDWARVLGRQYGDLSAFSVVYNRGKRALSLDMKDEKALSVVTDMAMKADVIIEAFRPGVMQKFGLDYETVRKHNPDVIYLSVTGFGPEGPMIGAPATDAVLQAFSGFMNTNKNPEGTPQRLDLIIIDVVTGLYGFQAIVTSVLEKIRTGKGGKRIDCSLMKSAIAVQAGKIVEHVIEGGVQAMYVPLGVLASSDGYISISVRQDEFFVKLCEVLGCPEVAADSRYNTAAKRIENEKPLMEILRAEFARRTTKELCELLTQGGVLHSEVNTYDALLEHDQVKINNAVSWQKQDGISLDLPMINIPGAPPTADLSEAPHIGQDSVALLKAAGLSQQEIDELIERRAVRAASA